MADDTIARPYLLFLGTAPDNLWAKTAHGVAHWRPEWCVGQFGLDGCTADVGLENLTINEAVARGAKTLVIGVAPHGGILPPGWSDTLIAALAAGLDIAAGLHTRLTEVPEIAAAAKRHSRRLIDVRHPNRDFDLAGPDIRPGNRLLTVGTDCCVGKMFAALAIEREMRGRGINADFRATGQTGIFIAERGVSVDAVVSDFLSGAAAWLTPANEPDHWDVVEGQGSLFHVSYAGVSLGLLHGSQPHALVLCHDAGRDWNDDFPEVKLPSLEDCATANLAAARISNPDVRLAGIALNTSALAPDDAKRVLADAEDRLGVPCADPVTTGMAAIVDGLQ
ncbi:MAG: N-acetyltransferase DgcN [Alphaproteobacteria bacterium]